MPAPPVGKPLVATLLLRKGVLPDMAAVVESLTQRYPEDPPSEATRGPESAVFRWGGGPIAVALKSEPVAGEVLESACDAAWWWEGAAEKLQEHKAHLIVSLAPSGEDAVDRHLRLTRVVAAMVSVMNDVVAGVFWTAGDVVHEPRTFAEQAAEVSRESLNPALWVQMRIVPGDDESWALYTTGLTAFGRPEIEIPRTSHQPAEVYELCAEVIGYLLVSGEELAGGGVISRSEEEQIEVRYGPSMFDDEGEVMQLEF